MSHRFFVNHPISGPNARITADEAHHLRHVMRVRRHQVVELFDGTGQEYVGEVIDIGRDWVELSIKSSERVDRELGGELIVGVAMPKGERQKFLVEKLVELGATALVPLHSARSVAQVGDGARCRLQRMVIEASKQCGRNQLMRIEEPADCPAYFARPDLGTKVIATPAGGPLHEVSWRWPVSIAVGPEGGFTDEELSLAQDHRWHATSLGSRILRVETAAIFLTAIASHFAIR
jgi:16S rRNA (uracil1498-N3)-methyltransferase